MILRKFKHVVAAIDRRGALLLAGLFLLTVLAACRNQQRIVVPNRVLDRPLDLVLTCMKRTEAGGIEALGLEACNSSTTNSCTTDDVPQLIGFVANSERNEVAVLRRCDTTAAVVDLDGDAPGYQLVPVGQIPSKIVATELGCKVITANAESCDLSVLDGPGLAGIALEVPPVDAPSSLISRLVVVRSDGLPLGARPGDMLRTPDRLSSARAGAPVAPEPDPDADSDSLGDDFFEQCAPDKAESLWMTFPTCQLVAEISVQTGQILQSRKLLKDANGAVTVIDGGTAPSCPVDCPIQFPDGVPPSCAEGEVSDACRQPLDVEGFDPTALAFVEPIAEVAQRDTADDAIRYSSLFVGGLGSDTLVEIAFETSSGEELATWAPPEETLQLTLERPNGLHAVRVTPPVTMADGVVHQFIYAIAGDGSTHVVSRDFDNGALGVECDTQIDPTVTPAPFPSCNAIDPNTIGQTPSPDRRPFAVGPGIRVSDGAALTDWTFFKVHDEQGANPDGNETSVPDGALGGSAASPFAVPGLVGVGVSSFGRVVVGIFNQLQDAGRFNTPIDPVGIMDVSVPPHSLWPLLDPLSNVREALPRVGDDEADRALPAGDDSAQTLAPTVRKIDVAYALPSEDISVSIDRLTLAQNLGNISNADQLGRFDGTGFFENVVPRVVARDYQAWRTAGWSLLWEGTIPGTRSSTGRLECERPGWENGTCLPPNPEDAATADDVRVIDDSAAFCDDGVLAGDKLVILGCASDDECGLGQRCLREPTAPSTATGICISAQAFEDEFEVLRQICAPFITDPCGQPRREYVITAAFQNELYLQAMDVPRESFIRDVGDDDGAIFEERDGRYTCSLPVAPAQTTDGSGNPIACTTDEACTDANPGDSEDEPGGYVCANDGICRGRCPGGDPECFECAEDNECSHFGEGALCSAGRCRRPCASGSRDCVQSLLPGPRCFPELVDYVVRTRNQFIVEGDPVAPFITDRVVTDPTTGACREDESVSALLTSRIRLGVDESDVLNDPYYGIPDCPNPSEAAPGDPNPCRVTQPRAGAEASRYHTMSYLGQTVEAIRFSNPYLSMVLDLTDLESLATPTTHTREGAEMGVPGIYGPEFAEFRRSRIPRGYRESFATLAGYIPISQVAVVVNTVLVYPVRIIPGATSNTAYIVDAGGRGGPAGVRGQIVRINVQSIDQGGFEDTTFLVR